MSPRPDAAAMLDDAERSRAELTETITVPPGYYGWLGGAVGVQIATMVVGLAVDAGWARASLAAGVAVFGAVAGIQLVRFRRLNGVWPGGFVSRAVFGTATTASLAYAVSAAGAYAAATQELWWLAAALAAGGGAAYALSGRRWLRRYRQDPAGQSAGESALLLATLVGLAAVGLVLLLLTAR